jgi:hypothetical protein
MPHRSRKYAQDPQKRVGYRKTEEHPKVTQGEKSKVTQADGKPGPL